MSYLTLDQNQNTEKENSKMLSRLLSSKGYFQLRVHIRAKYCGLRIRKCQKIWLSFNVWVQGTMKEITALLCAACMRQKKPLSQKNIWAINLRSIFCGWILEPMEKDLMNITRELRKWVSIT